MSLFDCIQRAIDDGQTDRARGEATQRAWREQARRYARITDRRSAEEMAYQDILEAFRRDTAINRHARLKVLEAMRRNEAEVRSSEDLIGAVRGAVVRGEGRVDQVDNAWYEMQALETQFKGGLSQFYGEIHRNLLGNVKNISRLENVVREIYGRSTGDASARGMADAMQETFERMRLMFNEAGGHIGKLEGGWFPQVHDRQRLSAAGKENWVDQIFNRLDWDRIENRATGRPFADAPIATRQKFLEDIWEGIVFQRAPADGPRYGQASGQGRLSNQHADPRVLHFRDPDQWMEYNELFGGSTPFEAVSQHIHTMARDIALMRRFGPNPQMGLEHRLQVAMDEARKRGDDKLLDRVIQSGHMTRAMMDQVTGASSQPANQMIANFFSGVRQFTTSAYLGSAMLASGGDLASLRMAAKSVGMNPTNALSRHVELMASSTTRETAARLGYIADTLTDSGNTLARFLGEVPSNEILERFSSGLMRAQGLSFWTDMGRTAFRMEFAGLFAENAGKALRDVTPELRQILEARGVSEADWAAFSDPSLMFRPEDGVTFISPSYWRNATDMPRAEADRIATLMGSIVEEQLEFAIPTMSVQARAAIQMGTQPGTISGEVILSLLQFKSFSLSVWHNQTARMMSRPTVGGRVAYGVEMLATFTAMGAIGVQLKELAKGNDPRDMTTVSFWGASLMQGGGLGIVGDLLSSSEDRTGGGFGSFLLGPTIGLLGAGANLTVGNALRVARGEDVNFGREVARIIERNTPILSSYWPTRNAVDRMLFDNLQRMLDPEANQSFRSQESYQEQTFGNESFWGAGDTAPRAPDFSNMFGG